MGSKFTNIQVHLGDRPIDEVRAAVAEVYRQRMVARGYRELPGDDPGLETGDRAVYFVPDEEGRWLGVFDEESEFGTDETVKGLASALSAAAQGYALGIRVVDSDALELFLYCAGIKVDWRSNDPEHPEANYGNYRRKRDFVGKPELWRELLVGDATPADLRAAWDQEPVCAEETLRPLAALFGGQEWWGWGSWQDLDGSWRINRDEIVQSGSTTRLAFRPDQPQAQPQAVVGPPRLINKGGPSDASPIVVSLGDSLEPITVMAANAGGVGRGVGVMFYGDAVEQGLIDQASVTLTVITDINAPRERLTLPLIAGESLGHPIRFAYFRDLALPAAQQAPPTADPRFAWFQNYQLNQHTWVVSLAGTATVPGSGTLVVSIVPFENREAGRVDWQMALAIEAPPRRPRKAATTVSAAQLRSLMDSDWLTAIVALGADRQSLPSLIKATAERWWSSLSPQSDAQAVLTLHADVGLRPKQQRMKAQRLLQHRRWGEWVAATDTCQSMGGMLEDWSAGFTFDAHAMLFRPLNGADHLVPYLCLYRYLRYVDSDERERAVGTLSALVDELMVSGEGPQAFIARWDWRVMSGVSYTPYEIATNIHGGVTSGRAWNTRYLRGVTDRLWLGSALLSHIGDLEALARVSDLEPVGSGVRVTLKPSANMDALEEALDSIIPSRDDWQEAERQSNTVAGAAMAGFLTQHFGRREPT